MAGEKVTVSAVIALEDDGGAGDPTLRLADGTTLKVPRDLPQRAYIEAWAKRRKTAPLYVESDASSGEVRVVWPTAERRIARVADHVEDEQLEVEIYMSPARHFLCAKRVGFAEAARRLREAAASGMQPLLLTVHPSTLEILDARPPTGHGTPI